MKVLVIILVCMIPGLIAFPMFPRNDDDIHSKSEGNQWPGRLKYIWRALLFSVIWPLLGLLILIAEIDERYQKKKKVLKKLKEFIAGTEEEDNNHHDGKLRFCHMGGAGNLYCRKCGHEEYIVSFLHGLETGPHAWHESGYQCQMCGKIKSIEKDLWLKKIPKCECGGELSKEEGLFCPKCKSFRMEYKLKIIT